MKLFLVCAMFHVCCPTEIGFIASHCSEGSNNQSPDLRFFITNYISQKFEVDNDPESARMVQPLN